MINVFELQDLNLCQASSKCCRDAWTSLLKLLVIKQCSCCHTYFISCKSKEDHYVKHAIGWIKELKRKFVFDRFTCVVYHRVNLHQAVIPHSERVKSSTAPLMTWLQSLSGRSFIMMLLGKKLFRPFLLWNPTCLFLPLYSGHARRSSHISSTTG